MNKVQLILASFLILVFFSNTSCNSSQPETNLQETAAVEETLSIPGTILLPEADDFTELIEQEHEAILLYCWLPMGEYPESTNDLQFLSTVYERNITAIPIQFSTTVRNSSQTQLNEMGIPLSVALGDDSLENFMNIVSLPTAVLVRKDGSIERTNGFGCAERSLRGTQ